jgi:ABC-type proline/glycine betaine transport system permease subunit
MEWIFDFPNLLNLNTTAIDDAVRSFAVRAETVLGAIKAGLNSFVNSIEWILRYIPWPVFLLMNCF